MRLYHTLHTLVLQLSLFQFTGMASEGSGLFISEEM